MVDEIFSDVRRIAEGKRLKNVGTLILVYLIRVLIAFIPVTLLAIINFIVTILFDLINANLLNATFTFVYQLIVELVSIATFICTAPFLFGCINYFFNEAKENKEERKIGKYLHNPSMCVKQMGLIFRMSLFTFLGLLCFIIPGVIYFLKRVMAPLILIEDESLSITEALVKSRDIMENRYKDLLKVAFKILLPSLIMYVLSTYLMHFGGFTHFIGSILSFATIIVFLLNLSDTILAVAVMYTKINGKKAGAIDVEYREIND